MGPIVALKIETKKFCSFRNIIYSIQYNENISNKHKHSM
jgi:hypothetical protein